MVPFEVFQNFFFFLDLPAIVFGFFVSNLDFELVVFKLLLLSFNFNTQVKKLLFQPWLILFEVGLFGLVWEETLLDLDGGGKDLVDEFLAFFGQHFQLYLLFLFRFHLFQEFVVGLGGVYYLGGVGWWKRLLIHGWRVKVKGLGLYEWNNIYYGGFKY
jgi:hypothetical protein